MSNTPDSTSIRQLDIQRAQDERDSASGTAAQGDQQEHAVQAGASEQPVDLPAQHLPKPGLESELQLAPRFLAPDYLGSRKPSTPGR